MDFNSGGLGTWHFNTDPSDSGKVFADNIMINTAISGAPYLVVLSGIFNSVLFENE